MGFEQKGIICAISPEKQVSEKFKTREFVVETTEEVNGEEYVNYSRMQFVQNKCSELDKHAIGDEVSAHFVVKGRKYTNKQDGVTVEYMSTLQCYKLEMIKPAANQDL